MEKRKLDRVTHYIQHYLQQDDLKKIIYKECINHLIFQKDSGNVSVEKLCDDIVVAIENHIKFERDNQPLNIKDFHG